jgi:hypothetical protein
MIVWNSVVERLVSVLMLSFRRCLHDHVIQHLGRYPCAEPSPTLLGRPLGCNEVGLEEKAYPP